MASSPTTAARTTTSPQISYSGTNRTTAGFPGGLTVTLAGTWTGGGTAIDPANAVVEFQITNRGSEPVSDDANNNTLVIGSDNQDYTSVINPDPFMVGSPPQSCTNFDGGTYTLEPGQSVIGCIGFTLPSGVTPSQVHFTLSRGFSNETAEWTVNFG